MSKLITDCLSMTAARQLMMGKSKRFQRAYNNDFSALNPTIWAQEAIVQLLPNMVLANLIARDFDNQVAKFGDVVNAFVPGTFEMNTKGALCENVVVQDATGSTLQVPLDQWPQVSFLICDGEENRAALDLVDTLLTPAVIAMAQGIDRILNAQAMQFIDNVAGHLLNGDSTNVRDYILEAREEMNRKNVPLSGRAMILTPGTETEVLSVDQLTLAYATDEGPSAIRDATLGRRYGFDIYMGQTASEVTAGQTTLGTVTVNGAVGAGGTTVDYDGANAASVAAGQWAVFAGDDTPQQILTATGNAMTIAPGLKRAVPDNAAITILTPGLVNNAAGYIGTSIHPRVIGYRKEILVDTFPNSPPQLGQLVSFGTDPTRYTITRVNIYNVSGGNFGIILDRPLANPIGNNMTVNLGPAGTYSFGFLRNGFTMVNRPLPQPRTGTGAISRVLTDPVNKISIRVTITYDGEKQGHLVTLDTLLGVGVLNTNMGVVMLG